MLTLETPMSAACCSQSQELQLAGEGKTASHTKASQQGHSAFQKCFQNLLGGGAVGGAAFLTTS